MLRDNLKKLITYDLVFKREVLSHGSTMNETLEAFPDGTIGECRYVSDNSWGVLNGTTDPVAVIDSSYCSCGCNCDWCMDWKNAEDDPGYLNDDGHNVCKDYDGDFDAYISDCIENSCWSASDKIDEICSYIDGIEYGYFDDENEDGD